MYKFSGERLRAARRAKGMRREYLAVATDHVVRTIENYETGRSEPNVSTAYALARALGLDIADLLEEVGANVA